MKGYIPSKPTKIQNNYKIKVAYQVFQFHNIQSLLETPLESWEVSPSGIHFINLFTHESEEASSLNLLMPGQAMKRHFHEHGVDIFHIISGQGELHHGDINADGELSNEEVFEVKAGDFYYAGTHKLHALVNTGKEPLTYLNIAPSAHRSQDWSPVKE
jgi:mannose-6-phosphate isomerase-like protein (cupin superfamily)